MLSRERITWKGFCDSAVPTPWILSFDDLELRCPRQPNQSLSPPQSRKYRCQQLGKASVKSLTRSNSLKRYVFKQIFCLGPRMALWKSSRWISLGYPHPLKILPGVYKCVRSAPRSVHGPTACTPLNPTPGLGAGLRLRQARRLCSRLRLRSVAKLQIRSELKVRQKRTRSFLIWSAFVAL